MSESASPPIRRALISVSDKTGLLPFARFLVERGVHILSTFGSAHTLCEAGLAVTEVADYTGFPEMLDGRVKTLHPRIHGGLLGRRDNADHAAAMVAHGILPIDLLVVNLYPFEQTVAQTADVETCIEMIDIGGPALIRAPAKNHASVTVVVDPSDYPAVREAMAMMQPLPPGLPVRGVMCFRQS
ncbi:MAG: phosphoribosylaminoimidazolecarboxamide formyltransferase / IMP cyclohydrolase [Rhodospirillaceae bacterium]|nr:MAG: phosphoribosylaminoimidazolecarboxamide formyltransferase / IMP cyclohydrolase [Rhodospirillaceae bacterium]